MFEAGNILYGYFDLGSNGKKNKYAIVLHNDPLECIITTFTTSQPRSSVASPVHGRNPSQGEVMSYVFKSYTLYKCKRTKRKYKLIFESILHGLGGAV